jgi:hypothetical protein
MFITMYKTAPYASDATPQPSTSNLCQDERAESPLEDAAYADVAKKQKRQDEDLVNRRKHVLIRQDDFPDWLRWEPCTEQGIQDALDRCEIVTRSSCAQ